MRQKAKSAKQAEITKRGQILVAAERVFFARGYDRASVDELRKEAGVSKGTIYAYFDSKADLFCSLCDEIHDRIFAGMIHEKQSEESDREWMVRFGASFACLMTSDPAISAARMVIAVADRMPEHSATLFESGYRKGHTLLRDFIEARGILSSLEASQVARLLLDLFLSGTHRERILGLMSEQEAHKRVPVAVERAISIAHNDLALIAARQ